MANAFYGLGFGRTNISHYYGDMVRQFLLAAAVVLVVGDGIFRGYVIPIGLLPQIGLALLFILLAALTSPHGRIVMWFDVVVSGVGLCLFEFFAISAQSYEPIILFLIQELIALFLICAFYYSVKTLRAFTAGLIGHYAPPEEFGEKD